MRISDWSSDVCSSDLDEDTADFHAAMKAACDPHDPTHYPRFRQWADEYFYIPHRQVHRGVGGIFYDHLEGDFDANFAFTQSVGEAFLDIFPKLVRRRKIGRAHV